MKRIIAVILAVSVFASVLLPVGAVVLSTTALLFGASAVVALAMGILGLQQAGTDAEFRQYCNQIASSERIQAAAESLGFAAAFASGWLPILLRREMVDQLQPDGSTVQVQQDTTYIPEELLLAIANELIATGAYAGSQTVIPPSTGWSLIPAAANMPALTGSLVAQSISTTYDFFGEFIEKCTATTYKQGVLDSYGHFGSLLDSIGYSRSAPMILGYTASKVSDGYNLIISALLIDRATTARVRCRYASRNVSLVWDDVYYSNSKSDAVNGYTVFPAVSPVFYSACDLNFKGSDVYLQYTCRMNTDAWVSDTRTTYSDSYSKTSYTDVLYIPYGTDMSKLNANGLWGDTIVVSQYGGELSEPIVPPSAVPVEPQPGVVSGDTIGSDVINGLDELVGSIDGWQDYIDKGVEIPLEGTGAGAGSLDTSIGLEIDIPIAVDEAGNPVIDSKPQGVTDAQDGIVSDVEQVVASSSNVAENQDIVDKLLDWARGYISFDNTIFRKFPLSIIYDIYAFFGIIATGEVPGVSSVMDVEAGKLPAVSGSESGEFQPVFSIPLHFPALYLDTTLEINLTPWETVVQFARLGEGLLFAIGLITYELNRRKQ